MSLRRAGLLCLPVPFEVNCDKIMRSSDHVGNEDPWTIIYAIVPETQMRAHHPLSSFAVSSIIECALVMALFCKTNSN